MPPPRRPPPAPVSRLFSLAQARWARSLEGPVPADPSEKAASFAERQAQDRRLAQEASHHTLGSSGPAGAARETERRGGDRGGSLGR